MRFESKKAQVKQFFFQYQFKTKNINNQPDGSINSSAECIAECLQAQNPPERRVKKIYDWQKEIPCCMNMLSHNGGKGNL